MHLLSVDLETTGLNGNTDQILEIACVTSDLTDPEDKRYAWRRLVCHSAYQGSAFALAMNSQLLYEIDAAEKSKDVTGTSIIVTLEELVPELLKFISCLPFIETCKRLTLTGKNVGSFDLSFLRMVPGFNENFQLMKLGHRCMDPGPLYFRPGDLEMPDLKTCLFRAGFEEQVMHRALDDAHAVLNVVRAYSERVIHIKSERVYDLSREVVINATNGDQEGKSMRLYRNESGEAFVRNEDEFDDKFVLARGK